MKQTINNIKIAVPLVAALAILIVVFYSCKKESVGKPEITKVRVTDVNKADSSVTKAQPGTTLVIEGRNLSNATQVLVNDKPVFFNPTLNTDNYIIFQIPRDAPTPDRFDVPNTIKVITLAGEAVYSFATQPPPPVLTGIVNYNPKPGTVMEIHGINLYGVNEIIFPGGKLGTNITKSEDGSILSVTVPADLDPTISDYLKINSPFGNTKSSFKVNTMYAQGAFANFDGAAEPGCGCWYTVPNSATLDAAMYPSSTGKYIRMTFGAATAPNGNTSNAGRSYNYGGTATKVILDPAVLSQAPDDYYLLFEINTRKPITGGALRATFGSSASGFSGNYGYDILLAANGVFDTQNKWQTVMMPLKGLNFFEGINWSTYYATSLRAIATLSEIFKPTGQMNGFYLKTIATKATKADGTVVTSGDFSDFDAAFDNFRIEKISK